MGLLFVSSWLSEFAAWQKSSTEAERKDQRVFDSLQAVRRKQRKSNNNTMLYKGLTNMFMVYVAFGLALINSAHALSVHGLKTLVVYDNRVNDLEDYSSFFDSLKRRSYDIEFASVNNDTEKIKLYEGDTRLVDNLIIFPIKGRQIHKDITVKSLLRFFEEGGDILTVTSPAGLPDAIRIFTNQLGIYPSPKDNHLLDYFQGSSDVIEIPTSQIKNKYVFSPEKESTLVYKGSAALLDNNELIVPVLPAPRTSFTKNLKKKEEWVIGSQGYTIAGFQNLHNSRATWAGSDLFFSNENYSSNGEFIEELTKWTFREKAVVKSTGVEHSHADGASYEELPYKVKDSVTYEIGLSEWNGEQWVPFIADDVQFELKMIDPYYRLTLNLSKKTEDSQYYTTGRFDLPDHHGVFTFLTDYKRTGLSFVTEKDVKAIRHLANDEYSRSWEITNAWVYLTSIYAVIFAWVLFVIFYITSTNGTRKVAIEKKTN